MARTATAVAGIDGGEKGGGFYGDLSIDPASPRFDLDLGGPVLDPETRIELQQTLGQTTPGAADAAKARVVAIKTALRDEYEASISPGRYQTLQAAPNAIDHNTIAQRRADLDAFMANNPGHEDGPLGYAALDRNTTLVNEWNKIADRAAWDIVRNVGPFDTATAAWRMGVNGEYTLENGLAVGLSLVGAAGTLKSVGGLVGVAAERTAISGVGSNSGLYKVGPATRPGARFRV
ncbi:hypothetical protein AB5I41_23660 [Sphingomonas sp. MMS24-JH45]